MSKFMDDAILELASNPHAFSTGVAGSHSGLSLHTLRGTNVRRCQAVFHPLNDWSLNDWATAVAGEVGEFCNVAKKIRRLSGGDQKLDSPEYRHLLEVQAVVELADVVIYADLAAAVLRKDLAAAIIWKFNKVSEERGTSIIL